MEIISLKFVILTTAAVFIHYLLPSRSRVGFLVFLSCAFSATFSPYLPAYLALYAAMNYFIGKKLSYQGNKTGLFRLGIFLNLTQLILLRYSSFAIDPIMEVLNADIEVSLFSNIIIPVGISYYTLQGIGYLINVKMGWERHENNFLRFFLYIIFFPKLLSGPIERSNHFLPQLGLNKEFNASEISYGFRRVLQGFFKKLIIANHLGNSITQLYSFTGDYAGYQIIVLILLQPLYLYFDFSGYTDVAIGFARTFGIELVPNFKRPFTSENMTTFWRRFHISLSSWFNDYIFKQISFRLRSLKEHATVIAVFLTWMLFGIWHGAGWNFMVLGLLQALVIYYEFRTKKFRNMLFSKIPGYARQVTGRIFTYGFYSLSLTFFFSPDLTSSINVFSEMFRPVGVEKIFLFNNYFVISMTFGILFLFFEILKSDFELLYEKAKLFWVNNKLVRIIVYYSTLILILTQLDGNKSFVYEMF